MTTTRGRILCVFLAATGCVAGEGDGGPDDDQSDQKGPDAAPPVLAPPCVNLDVRCPADLPEIGRSGAYAIDSFDIQWQVCEGEEGPAFAPFVHVKVPADIVSLAVTVDGGSKKTGFAKLKLGDTIFIKPDLFNEKPFYHAPLDWLAATVVFPIDRTTAPTGPACLAVLPTGDPKLAGMPGKIHIVSRRSAAQSLIDLNLVVVEGTNITDDQARATAQAVADIYTAAGTARIGAVNVVRTSMVPPKINVEGRDINRLRAMRIGDNQQNVNVFFIADFADDPGTLGFAGGIPGPIGLHGTSASGVVVAVDSHVDEGALDTQVMAETLAHEIGHQLGLFHTTESDGTSFDNMSDTPQCSADKHDADKDGEVSAEECESLDGAHMMFWVGGITQRKVSPMQSEVLAESPVTR